MPAAFRYPLIVALILLGAQLALIGHIELTFDEAYYTLWSRDLAWGYLDHPPMVAAWIRASTTLFGPSEFGVRALNALIFAAMPALIAFIAWRLFASSRIAALAALFWLATPLVAASVIVTPDSPLVAFWTLGLAAFVEVWRGRASAWIGVGLALGLAALSKFTAAFLGVGIVLAMIATPSLRRWFRSPAPYLAALLSATIFAPFVVWNAAHGWATFAKQFGRVPARGFAPRYLLEFLGGQIVLMNPLIFLAAAFGAAKPAAGRDEEARRLLVSTIAPAILYFLIHALHDRVQANWLAPLYPALVILAADAASRGPAWLRATARRAPPLGFAAIALAYLHVAFGWPNFGAADPLARVGGWRDLSAQVFARAHEEHAAFVLARGYAATSLLTYYGPASPPVVEIGQDERWLFRPAPEAALFAAPGLAFAEADHDPDLASRFRHVQQIARLPRRVGGADAQDFTLYRVSGPIAP